MGLNVDFLGQVFTPQKVVSRMLSLIRNGNNVLEPSCGDGAFFKEINGCTGIEFDAGVCPVGALNMDFFDFSVKNKFDTIIGNPPYVKYKNIPPETLLKMESGIFDKRTNLYLFFMEKCLQHLTDNGEIIFIVPRDFIKSTSSIRLNKLLFSMGTITDWFDLGDEIIFQGFSPNCVIFRFEKNNFSRKTNLGDKVVDFQEFNGQLIFSDKVEGLSFSDLFFVKVGAVSGADEYFVSDFGNMDFVFSETVKTGKTKRVFYNIEAHELKPFKEVLMARKIKKFNEKTWFNWGRGFYESDLPRIYVNSKTRNKNPFFVHDCKNYDGSVLAIFPKFNYLNFSMDMVCNYLNKVDWESLGFICDGRFLFSQKALENSFLPKEFNIFIKE